MEMQCSVGLAVLQCCVEIAVMYRFVLADDADSEAEVAASNTALATLRNNALFVYY